jgi:protein-arginine kinase activator protein McsA
MLKRKNSRLEVIFAPQRIAMVVNSIKEEYLETESDVVKIEIMLKKALQNEDYELASKFRDILKYQNKENDSDK